LTPRDTPLAPPKTHHFAPFWLLGGYPLKKAPFSRVPRFGPISAILTPKAGFLGPGEVWEPRNRRAGDPHVVERGGRGALSNKCILWSAFRAADDGVLYGTFVKFPACPDPPGGPPPEAAFWAPGSPDPPKSPQNPPKSPKMPQNRLFDPFSSQIPKMEHFRHFPLSRPLF